MYLTLNFSTLKFQKSWEYQHLITHLAPNRVRVLYDGSQSETVNFRGCKIIQISADNTVEKLLPTQLTIGGQCTYTKKDKKDFKIMMRTREQSHMMHFPTNGEYDWPDYKAFETCPFCWKRSKPDRDERYWLLYQPLLQSSSDNGGSTISIRFVCRLTCLDCFEELINDMYMPCSVAGDESSLRAISLVDAVESQGPVTWLRDGMYRNSQDINNSLPLEAYKLYSLWEYFGAWQAMSDLFGQGLSEYNGHTVKQRKEKNEYWTLSQIPTEKGRV